MSQNPRPIDEMFRRLTATFRRTFDDPELVVSPTTSARDVPSWDSFAHVNLIVAIEEEFNVSFTTREIGSFTCVGDVLDLLVQKTRRTLDLS